MSDAVARGGRWALILVMVGLSIQLGALFVWSPGTFVLSAAVGLPLVVAGAALFGFTVLRARRGRGDESGDRS